MKSINGSQIIDIFKNNCTYNFINKFGDIKLRHRQDGITIPSIIYYCLSYCSIDKTKDAISSHINSLLGVKFTRQAFESKSKHISINFYAHILSQLINLHNTFDNSPIQLVAFDGIYNLDLDYNQVLNIGLFDVTNQIPIDIKSFGKNGKNKEISSVITYIEDNIKKFDPNKVIFVGDRAYFSYDFIYFLIRHNFKFIIRGKGDCLNLENANLPKNTPKYKLIKKIQQYVRIIRSTREKEKILIAGKKINKNKLVVRETVDCNLITNIPADTYDDITIRNHYNSRWDIEVFYKYLRYNFKFNKLDPNEVEKMYTCHLILIYLEKILEKYYISKNENVIAMKDGYIKKINKTLLTTGIIDDLLFKLLHEPFTAQQLDSFCNTYIKITINKKGRKFPRNSKLPFSKWYIKGYSEITKYLKIYNAILNNKTNTLNKNLKLLMQNILTINT